MYGLTVFLVLLLPLSAQITPVFQEEISFSPTATEEPLDRTTEGPLFGFLSPSASPSIEPPEEDEWALVEAYLHSGNATLLAQANCSRSYRVPGLQGVPAGLLPIMRPALDALTNAANFLNMIFQANDLRESSVTEDMEWYHALVRGLLEGDPLIRQAILTFDAQPAALQPQLVLRASRPSSKPQDILLQDLSSAWELMHPPPPAPDASWFTALKFPEMPKRAPPLSKRVLLNDLRTLGTPKWGRGDSYVTNQDGVRWADAPFLECEGGRFTPGWLLTLSTSFYGLKPDLSPEFRGVIRVDVSIQSFDVDQCVKGKDWFSNTHQCNRTSMQCEPINGQGFRLGQYCCRCKEGYYTMARATQNTSIGGGSATNTSGLCAPALPVCLPCWPGCLRCEDGSPCRVQEDWYLRAGMLAVQGFFMLLVFISMLVAYQFRRSKRIRASGLLLLETILFGSLLLYFPVFILYFRPSTFRCILLRWVRLLGFAIVYGTLTLKMHRVLKVFLSRTAQRVPYMSSARLLRMLGVIVMTVSWFLSAWTAGALQNRDRNVPLLISSTTSEGQGFSLCDLDRWDYMMAVAEVLFLCWGSFLCNAVRTVPSAFHEPRYMGIAIHNELLLSATFHLLRFAVPSLHPDWMLLLFFTHTHVTVTVTLGLLFIPKFLHVSRPLREEIAAEVYEDEVDLRRSSSYFNSSFASAWSEHSLDPDDIRDELKKLYVQLEIHKTKKMTANNPHLQKKHISRRSLGHSIMRRITEIPESIGRRCSREDKEGPLVVRGGSQSGSSKKNVMESSSFKSKDESVQHCVLSIRKSHSTCDYVRDPQSHLSDTKDLSMLDSLMKMKLARKASVYSDTESVDAAPLVYKSASAQNLSAEIKLQPEPNKLQKSLSVMTRNKVSSTLHPNKTCSLEDTSQAGSASLWKRDPSGCNATIRTQTTQALLSGSFDMEEVCPWELEDHLPERKSQKHVTYALSQDSGQITPEKLQLPGSQQYLISPWNTLQPDQSRDNSTLSGEDIMSKDMRRKDVPHRNGNEGSDSDTESKPQVPVSSSAPGSPVTVQKRPKEHRVFSYHGAPRRFSLSVKGLVRSGKDSGKDKNKKSSNVKEKKKEPLGSKCLEKENTSSISPRAGNPKMENVHMKSDSKEEVHVPIPNISALQKQQRSMTNASSWVVDSTKPCLVKQNAIRMSPVRNTKKQDSILVDGCSWQTEKMKKRTTDPENTYSQICPWETLESEEMLSQNSSHSNIGSREMKEEPPSIEHHNMSKSTEPTVAATIRNTDNQNVSVQMSVNAEICPWDIPEPPQPKTQRQQTSMADICSWGMKEINPSSVKKDTDRSASVGLKDIVAILRQRSVHTNICPWEIEEPKTTVKRQESDRINICPWESDEPEKAISQHSSVHANICPWETQELTPTQGQKEKEEKNTNTTPISTAKKSKEINPSPQTDVKAEVCPWDVSDPCQQPPKRQQSSVEDVKYDKKTTKKQESFQSATTEESDIANICPWEIQDDCLSKDSQDKVKYSPKPTMITTSKKHLDGKLPSLMKVKSKLCSLEILGSSQWAPKIHQSSVSEVRPWDVENLKETPKRQESLHAGIGHWETQENPSCAGSPNEVVHSKHSLITTPKRSGEQVLPIQTSVNVEVCPWDVPVPCQPTTLTQQSSLADVDHREVEVSNLCQEKVTSTLEGANDSEKTEQKLESVRANICPWETEEAEKTKEQESVRSNICPWEAQDTLGLESPGRDIKCKDTLQQSRSTGTSKQSSITEVCQLVSLEAPPNMADICPWETEGIKPCLVKQAAIRLSSEEAEALEATSKTTFVDKPDKIMKNQDSVRADVCPWEMEEPEKNMKKQENIPADICPWENQSAENIKAENSTLAEVWKTEEPEEKINQKTIHYDVCPWETEVESAIVKTTKQSSVEKITTDTTNEGKICQRKMEMPDMAAVVETDTKVSEPSKIEMDSNQPIVSGPGEAEGTKPNLPLGRRDALCPWEMQEVKPPLVDKEDSNTDTPPWECEGLAVDNDAESAAEAFFFPADL